MLSSFQSESLPALVTLSSGLAGGEITAKEYNGAQRVAAMEDSVKEPVAHQRKTKNLFYKTTWSKVEVGDVVLMPWSNLDRVVEVEITRCVTEPMPDGKPRAVATYTAFDCEFGQSFDPEETAYVQSRL